jgi:hypothetical protein
VATAARLVLAELVETQDLAELAAKVEMVEQAELQIMPETPEIVHLAPEAATWV